MAELRAQGGTGRAAATALDRLLSVKDMAQYDRRGVTETDAKASLRRARTLVESAEQTIAARRQSASGWVCRSGGAGSAGF